MSLFRNRQLRRELIFSVSATAALSAVAAWALSPAAAMFMLALGALLTGAHLLFTRRRYAAIRELSAVLDRILHGEDASPIAEETEGELSILKTQIRKMTLRLNESAENLLREKNALSDAMADLSHQLRTPLTAVNLVVSTLESETMTDERRLRLTRELEGLLRRMEWLVETMLKMSMIDAGAIVFAPKRISAEALIRLAASPLEIPMELKGIAFEAEAENASLVCDPAWTAQAIGNLLRNAVQHTPAGGRVRAEARETPLFTEIRVLDTGEGFAPEDIPHLFERFYKGKNAKENSVGIGLAFARQIAAAQNAALTAENRPEGGAAFLLRFYKQVI